MGGYIEGVGDIWEGNIRRRRMNGIVCGLVKWWNEVRRGRQK